MATKRKARPSRGTKLPGIDDARMLAAYAEARAFLKRAYVTGVAIGSARRDGRLTDEPAICVYVDRKRARSELPKSRLLPRQVGGVPVDVVQMVLEPQFVVGEEGRARRETRAQTLQPGLQVKTSTGNAGTIALAARTKKDGSAVILTAGHVAGSSGVQVYQPFGNAVAHLVGIVKGLSLTGLDAACAGVGGRGTRNVPFGSQTRITRIRKAREKDVLQMSGAFSGMVEGVVGAIGETKTIFPSPSGSPRTLVGFFLNPRAGSTGGITTTGDSGSLWFDAMGNAVGLHVAGGFDKGEAWAFACDIGDVLDALGLEL